MANWQTTLDLNDVWKSEDPKKISTEIMNKLPTLDLTGIGNGTIKGLTVPPEVLQQMRDELVEEFRELS